MSEAPPVIVWFRRDLRLADNPALSQAAGSGALVIPLFIHDEAGEGEWPSGGASRWWLRQSLTALSQSLEVRGSKLVIMSGDSESALLELSRQHKVSEVYWNRRYEPSIVARDTRLKRALAAAGVQARSFNGSLLHSPLKIANKSGGPFKVYTPFWRHISALDVRETLDAPEVLRSPTRWPKGQKVEDLALLPSSASSTGFAEAWTPGEAGAQAAFRRFRDGAVDRYERKRDVPSAEDGVSRLSPHLHFGEISPVQVWAALGLPKHEAYLRQIGWREFAYHLLFHFPDTTMKPLRPEFAHFPWEEGGARLKAWQQGMTGYPLIDAGMRQLRATGWMHNRARMVAASFLVKHLLVPWQDGAAWFWQTLVDADLANNTMGWQWVAGCGADAAPYFRIFNPMTQGERFDPDGAYTRKWIPELKNLPGKYLFKPWEAPVSVLEKAGVSIGGNYPSPIVSHPEAREAALVAYQKMKDAKA